LEARNEQQKDRRGKTQGKNTYWLRIGKVLLWVFEAPAGCGWGNGRTGLNEKARATELGAYLSRIMILAKSGANGGQKLKWVKIALWSHTEHRSQHGMQ